MYAEDSSPDATRAKEQEHHRIANMLVTVCATLGELPHVRFDGTRTDAGTPREAAASVARILQDKLEALRANPTSGFPSRHLGDDERPTLLLLELSGVMVLLRCAGNCVPTVCGGRLRPQLVAMSADHQPRVRVGVPNSELLADATTVKKEINEVGVGSFKMTFNHDMTSSFKWGGIILLLIILKVVLLRVKVHVVTRSHT